MVDPVLSAIDAAPTDDLPETEAERHAIATASVAQVRPHADVVRALEPSAAE